MNRLHLVCNAHLDPVWLWEWEEGATAALATFRVAAGICEEHEHFVFNHNEALLYRWVEKHEPDLFERIRKLIKQGRWRVIGGWYVQPDCNMPSGESLVRQALIGKTYFREKFGVEPKTGVNFDSFGHSRGLVQILAKSGYTAYLHTRPSPDQCELPGEDYLWIGYDGSKIMGHRAESYNTWPGKAAERISEWIDKHQAKPTGMALWGIGNHGGGPSRQDLENLAELARQSADFDIIHSTPDAYFEELDKDSLPRHEKDINPFSVGCYTSQIRVKQRHRQLENELYMTEKMASGAAMQGLLSYPTEALGEALDDLLLAEFHDMLPGTSIQDSEQGTLRLMDHGLEIVSRAKLEAFLALAQGQPKAEDGAFPVLIYNPHPFPVQGVFAAELNLQNVGWRDKFTNFIVYRDGTQLPCQPEKERHNVNIDWRRRTVFEAELAPGRMNRFDCIPDVLRAKPEPRLAEKDGRIDFRTDDLEVVVNCATGLIDRYTAHGVDYLRAGAFRPLVIADSPDSWAINVKAFPEVVGAFQLMSPEEGTQFSGVTQDLLPSVRIVEDGDVRTVVEALFRYGDSFICQTYRLPKRGVEIEVDVRVYWNEKTKMLKLSVPTVLENARYLGQVAYGVGELPANGNEAVAQKWVAVVSDATDQAVTCINDGQYGSDFKQGELRLSLLRSAAYSAHYFEWAETVLQDRFTPRMDQGERSFRFWFSAGAPAERLAHVDREALAHNEVPFVLAVFPSGTGQTPKPTTLLSDNAIQLTAFKKAEQSDHYVIRLFEPTGQARTTTLELPALGLKQEIRLGGFEIKTLRLDVAKRTLEEVNLLEQP